MFERYTEKARRVIFFARYEASQFGSPHQRENLRALREKFHLDDSSSPFVGLDHLKEVVSRWAAYPYCP